MTWAEGNGGVEVDSGERRADDVNGGVAFGQGDLCAHGGEGFADALHGAKGEGVVANEGKLAAMLRGDEAGEHAHSRAGVAAVERGGGLLEGAGDAGDLNVGVVVDDGGAQGSHAGKGGVGVGAGGEVGQARRALGEAGEHGVTVRDGFVTGEQERALERAGGVDDLCGHEVPEYDACGVFLAMHRNLRAGLPSKWLKGLAKSAEDGENRKVRPFTPYDWIFGSPP